MSPLSVSTDANEPWVVNIDTQIEEHTATVGTWILVGFGGEGANLYPNAGSAISNTSNAVNDTRSWPFVSSAGVWAITLHTRQSTNVAIYTVQIDGVTVGTYDGYAAAIAYGKGVISGIALSAGLHTIKIIALAKNASSSSYAMNLFGITMRRTA